MASKRMKYTTHLIIAIIEFIVAAILLVLGLSKVTNLNIILFILHIIILSFGIIHICVFASARRLGFVVFINFKKFKSYISISESSYNIKNILYVEYNHIHIFENEFPNTIYIHFKSVINYFQYWIFKYNKRQLKLDEWYNKIYTRYINSVTNDIEKSTKK